MLVIPARVIVYFFISLPGPAVRDPLGVLCVSSRSARNIQRRLSTACVNAVDVSPQRRLLRAVQCDSTRFDPPTANNAKDRGQRVPPSFPGGRCRLLVHVSSFFFFGQCPRRGHAIGQRTALPSLRRRSLFQKRESGKRAKQRNSPNSPQREKFRILRLSPAHRESSAPLRKTPSRAKYIALP